MKLTKENIKQIKELSNEDKWRVSMEINRIWFETMKESGMFEEQTIKGKVEE